MTRAPLVTIGEIIAAKSPEIYRVIMLRIVIWHIFSPRKTTDEPEPGCGRDELTREQRELKLLMETPPKGGLCK